MDNDREYDQIMMNVRSNTGAFIAAAVFSGRLTFKLLTFIARMVKKGFVAAGFGDRFKDFTKSTNGNYSVYNVPVTGESAEKIKRLNELELKLENEPNRLKKTGIRNEIKKLQKEIPEAVQLKKLGINFCVLPKLNGSLNTIQIAVDRKSDQPFKNWFLNHLTTGMAGGEKSMEELKVFTEGNYAIYNVPFEGEELQAAFPDWATLGINYSLLPDLKVGDDNSQVAVANADRSKMEVWFKMWKEQQLSQGNTPGDMYVMNQETYMNTGTMSADEYVNTSEPIYQQANEEFEQKSEQVPWTIGLNKENSPEYVRYLQDDGYEKITINKESLVDKMTIGIAEKEMSKQGYFISRVPTTFGDSQKTLILPKEQVFTTDDGKTFIAFLPKNKPIMVADSKGTISENNFPEVYKIYDVVTRNLDKVKELQEMAPTPKVKMPTIKAGSPSPKL